MGFSPDGKRLLYVEMQESPDRLFCPGAVVIDAASGRELLACRQPHQADSRPRSAAFSADGKTIAIDYWDDMPSTVELWDVGRGTQITTIKIPSGKVNWIPFVDVPILLAFSPSDKVRAAPNGRMVHFFDSRTGKRLHSFIAHDAQVTSLAMSPDGKRLASGSTDGTVLIWDYEKLAAKWEKSGRGTGPRK